jgi:transcriptional regulator with XRE-family HTH domain
MSEQQHTSYAEKFEFLLELFPHPERQHHKDPEQRKWKMFEIRDATRGEVSVAYLSALRKGKNKRPGMKYLDLIANVMDFPIELWLSEPSQWSTVSGNGEQLAGSQVPGIDDTDVDDSYAGLLNHLFSSVTNRKTGHSFTEREIAQRTGGVLTESDVKALRDGSFNRPSREELIALSNAFSVSVNYWFSGAKRDLVSDNRIQELMQYVQGDERRLEALNKTFGASNRQVEILLSLLEEWEHPQAGE